MTQVSQKLSNCLYQLGQFCTEYWDSGDFLRISSKINQPSSFKFDAKTFAAHSSFEMCWRQTLFSFTCAKGSFQVVVESCFGKTDICENQVDFIFLLTGLRMYTGEYKAQGPMLCPTKGRALWGPQALDFPVQIRKPVSKKFIAWLKFYLFLHS